MTNLYERYELEAYIGSENLKDFDIDAIEDEATEIDYGTGNRVWRDGIDLNAICAAHEKAWKGEGWYRIGWSDGGQDWTNDGPIWLEFESQLDDELEAAGHYATETHLPFSEYMGCGDGPQEEEEDMAITAELYRRETGSTMSEVAYNDHCTLDEIAADLRESWDDWDYAIVSGYDEEPVTIERVEG